MACSIDGERSLQWIPCTKTRIEWLGYFLANWNVDRGRPQDFRSGIRESYPALTIGYDCSQAVDPLDLTMLEHSMLEMEWIEIWDHAPLCLRALNPSLQVGSREFLSPRLTKYLVSHLDERFGSSLYGYYGATPFIRQFLMTAYRFSRQQYSGQLREAFLLMIAYNFLVHIALIDENAVAPDLEGIDQDKASVLHAQFPVAQSNRELMRVKLAAEWRRLHSNLLYNLSDVIHSMYSKERMNNYPLVLLLSGILLVFWEEIQFDTFHSKV